MATVTKPLALDESINTTEQTPRNVADVLAEELQNIASAIGGGSGSGGHTIVNASGTDMAQRTKMQFVDAGVSDDSTEQATKVEVIQLIDDESELDDAPDGVYQGDYDDAPEDVLDASMVAYKNGSVEDALDNLPSVITTSVINCATISSNNYYGNLVTPSGYTAVGIIMIVSTNFTQSTGIVDYRIENNQVRIRVKDTGYGGSFDATVLFVKTS